MCKLHNLIFYSFFGKGILGELLQVFATINLFDINLILSIIGAILLIFDQSFSNAGKT